MFLLRRIVNYNVIINFDLSAASEFASSLGFLVKSFLTSFLFSRPNLTLLRLLGGYKR